MLFSDVVERAVEEKDEGVFPWTYEISNVEDGLAEHVGVTSEFLAVQSDGGEGIEALEDEAQPFAGSERFLGTVEGHAVPPLAVFDPGALLFVAVVEGIFNASGGDEGRMNVSGNVRVEPPRMVEILLEGARRASFSGGIVV
jgi:hypothetical protein